MSEKYGDLLDEGEDFDETKSLYKHNDFLCDEVSSEIDLFLKFAEEEITYLLQIHHMYSSQSEFFPIIELGEIKEEKECTTN